VEDDIRDERQGGQDRQDDIALLELASMIDEDQPIDWESEEGVVRGDDERAVLAELRVLAALTRVYRDPDAVGLETPLTEVQEPVEHGLPPATWGSLEVFEQVGRGGFAKVYRARDPLSRDVALKLFPVTPENAGALSSRVLREGSLLAKISHRNVVVVHGVERSNGFLGLWMEFIHGRTMEDELRARGPLSAEEATPIGIDLCQALAAVHRRGLVHRDVKAQNVMREDGGRTVLMDFGAGTELATGLREPIDTAGTPLYLAPELFDGRPATRASDIYSLGVLLYRMVTREYPVDGADRSQIERAHRDGRVRRLRDARPDLPNEFIQTVERALSPDPTARPQTAGEFEAALTGRTAPAAPPWAWWQRAAAVAAAIVLIAVPVAWFVSNQTNRPDNSNPSPAAAVERPPVTPAAAVNPAYTVQARMFRTRNGVETPLKADTELLVGDKVSMSIVASKEVYVYVLNTDDAGKTFRLFPLPDHRPDNPLAPSKEHRLPGDVGEDWAVDSPGGREHFVIMVNPVRVDAIEALVRSIPAATEGRGAAAMTTRDIGVLRSVGGLAKDKTIAKASEPALLWFEEASGLTSNQETASGAWMRRLTVPGARR
jgi:eukaryotic-like serine/threonine-protein kinase